MWITRVSINNPVFATMMMAALLVLGLFSYQRLNVDQFPDVSFPIVVIQTEYPGAAPETVESDVTRKIEEAVNTVSGIKAVSSRSFEGSSRVIAEFDLTADAVVAAQDVRDKIALVRPGFRREVKEPKISRFNPDDAPIISLALDSGTRDLRELTTLADRIVRKRLETVRGVGQATLVGGIMREIKIYLQPDRMRALGVGVDTILETITRENQELPAGSISTGREDTMVQVRGRIVEPHQFGSLIVAQRGGAPVRLDQVASVEDGRQEMTTAALVDGKPALSIDIVKVRGANTILVADGVRAAAAELRDILPPDVKLSVVRDSSTGIRNSVADVKATLIEGAALTIAIVFVFFNSWRSTVITGLTLPIALIGTFLAMYAFGYTLNTMTLMALSLSVGLLIDDAIVVRENIVRHLRMGKDHYRAALEGTQEIGLAVLATTFTIVAVFLPVAFMGGIIGRFFFQFGITVSAAVLLSLFVSFTLDPMLSSVWPDPAAHGKRGSVWGRLLAMRDTLLDGVHTVYGTLLRWAMRHRLAILALAFATFFGSFALVPLIGSEFAPQPDLGETQVTLKTHVGSSIEYTRAKVQQAQAALSEFPEVEYSYATVNSGGAVGKNSATLYVRLTDHKQRSRSQKQLQDPIRERLSRIGGIEISVGAGGGLGGGKPIQVSIQGADIAQLEQLSQAVMTAMRGIPGLVDIDSSLEAAKPTLAVDINRELASDLGLGVAQIANALRPLVAGEIAGSWKAPDGENYDVTVRLPREARVRAAIKPSPVVKRLGLPLDEKSGRIVVDRTLRVPGVDGVWAIGDAAHVPDPRDLTRPAPPTAQHAIRQGRKVAKNVAGSLSGKRPTNFRYKTLGVFVDLGRGEAVASTMGIRWRGVPAWFLARTYHLASMPGMTRKIRLVADWTVGLFFGRDGSELGRLGHPGRLDTPDLIATERSAADVQETVAASAKQKQDAAEAAEAPAVAKTGDGPAEAAEAPEDPTTPSTSAPQG